MILKCYPTLSELIYDWTGINIPLPVYSFGFFVAMAFIVGAVVLVRELKYRERLGFLKGRKEKIKVGAPATPWELIINGLVGFLLGFKLVPIISDYGTFVENPQEFLFSAEGSIIGGIIGAGLLAYLKYWEKKKEQLPKPRMQTVVVMPHQRIGDIVTIAAISGILGAKVFAILESPGGFREFFRDPMGNLFSGLTIYGGLIFGAAAVIFYALRKGINVLHLGDAISPALIIAYGVGRLGCQVSGDGDWGIVNTRPKPDWLSWLPDNWWAYNYPNNINQECNPYQGEAALQHSCSWSETPYLIDPVFPTPVYEIIMASIIFVFLLVLARKVHIPGLVFATYIFLNGLERFWIEKIRVNTKYDFLGFQWSQAEIIAFFMMLGGLFFMTAVLQRHHKKRKESSA